MAFGLGIKSRFWLFGLGGEPNSGNKYDRKFAVKPISGRNSNQKLGINPKTRNKYQILGIIQAQKLGLNGINRRKWHQKLGLNPNSGKNRDQKFDEYPKTRIKSNFWE